MGGFQSAFCSNACPWLRNRNRIPPNHCSLRGRHSLLGASSTSVLLLFSIWADTLDYWPNHYTTYFFRLPQKEEILSRMKCRDFDTTVSNLVGTGQVVSQDEHAKLPYTAVLVRDMNGLWWIDHGWLPDAHQATLSLPFLNKEKIQQNNSWVKIRTGRSLTNCHHRKTRLDLGKII